MSVGTGLRSVPSGRRERTERSITGRGWWVLGVALAGTFLAIMDSFIVNVAVPSVRSELNASFAQIELVVGGYVLVYGLLLVLGGRLGDLHGARRMFVAGVAVFTLASLAAGLAPDTPSLILARLAQGGGAALFYPQVLAVLRIVFDGRARATAFALFGATIGLASIAGQLVGGLLLHLDVLGLGWRMVFLVNVPVGVATVVGALRFLPSGEHASGRVRGALDVTGVVLLSAALLALSVPLVEGNHAGWPWWTWVSLASSLPLLVAFVVWERRLKRRGGAPLLDPDLLALRSFAAGNGIAVVFFAGNAGLFFVLTLTLQDGLGYSPLTAGLVFAPLAVTFAVASLIGPRLSARWGRHVLTLGYGVNAVGTAVLLATVWLDGAQVTGWALVGPLAIVGFGQGLGVSPLFDAALGEVPERSAGAAGGVLETAGQLGMSLGVTVLGLVFSTSLGDGPFVAASHLNAFTAALVGNLALAVAALVLLRFLTRPRTQPNG